MILLTGSNGFLGRYILSELNKKYHVDNLSRSNSIYNIDLSTQVPEFDKHYQIVIHNAGKAHSIPKSNIEKQEFYDVNVIGTKNLIKGLEEFGVLPKSFIFISSVSVYGLESGISIKENHPLLASDAYGKSKIEAELLVQEWCKKNNVICTILRLPLIAGPNPPGNLKAMIEGIKKRYYFNIVGGAAKKSMVLAEDVAKVIPIAAKIGGIYNLTDGYNPNFLELSQLISKQLGKSQPLNIPMWIAKIMAKVGDLMSAKAPINSDKLKKITSDLTFDDSKAQRLLNWKPTSTLKGFKIY